MKKSHLLINEPPLLVPPSLAKEIGLNEAIVLQQVHYWLSNAKNEGRVDEDGNKWVYNTYAQWQEDNFPFWSADKVQRIFLSLEKQGVIISAQLDAKSRDMTKFYRIAYEQLCMMDGADLPPSNTAKLHDVKMIQRLPETTTPSSKKKNTKKGDAIDGLLFYGKQAKDQGVDKVEELLCEIERGIHVNIQRSNDNQIIARKILKDGREFGRWLTWRIQDEWWAARLYIFADLTKMWEQWPAAFETKTDETRPEYQPFPLAGE